MHRQLTLVVLVIQSKNVAIYDVPLNLTCWNFPCRIGTLVQKFTSVSF